MLGRIGSVGFVTSGRLRLGFSLFFVVPFIMRSEGDSIVCLESVPILHIYWLVLSRQHPSSRPQRQPSRVPNLSNCRPFIMDYFLAFVIPFSLVPLLFFFHVLFVDSIWCSLLLFSLCTISSPLDPVGLFLYINQIFLSYPYYSSMQ